MRKITNEFIFYRGGAKREVRCFFLNCCRLHRLSVAATKWETSLSFKEIAMRILFILLIVALSYTRSEGQVLISLLLGDKLNTGKIEFGLDGGLSLSNLHGVSPSSTKPGFNLGFYFDFRLKNPAWALHTGVMVKSTLGAEDILVYSLNDQDLDNAFSGGSVV